MLFSQTNRMVFLPKAERNFYLESDIYGLQTHKHTNIHVHTDTIMNTHTFTYMHVHTYTPLHIHSHVARE